MGKSTLLNSLTNSASLARVSDKPGRTQQLTFFECGAGSDGFQLVDMPGYGFALANEETVAAWQALCAHYLQRRGTLKLVLVLVDARTGLKQSDLQMLEFLEGCRVKYALVLTKADLAGTPRRIAQLVAVTQQAVGAASRLQRRLGWRGVVLASSRYPSGVEMLQRTIHVPVATGGEVPAARGGARRRRRARRPRWRRARRRRAAAARAAAAVAAAAAPPRRRARGGRPRSRRERKIRDARRSHSANLRAVETMRSRTNAPGLHDRARAVGAGQARLEQRGRQHDRRGAVAERDAARGAEREAPHAVAVAR